LPDASTPGSVFDMRRTSSTPSTGPKPRGGLLRAVLCRVSRVRHRTPCQRRSLTRRPIAAPGATQGTVSRAKHTASAAQSAHDKPTRQDGEKGAPARIVVAGAIRRRTAEAETVQPVSGGRIRRATCHRRDAIASRGATRDQPIANPRDCCRRTHSDTVATLIRRRDASETVLRAPLQRISRAPDHDFRENESVGGETCTLTPRAATIGSFALAA
jgi:hypothetical protein